MTPLNRAAILLLVSVLGLAAYELYVFVEGLGGCEGSSACQAHALSQYPRHDVSR